MIDFNPFFNHICLCIPTIDHPYIPFLLSYYITKPCKYLTNLFAAVGPDYSNHCKDYEKLGYCWDKNYYDWMNDYCRQTCGMIPLKEGQFAHN